MILDLVGPNFDIIQPFFIKLKPAEFPSLMAQFVEVNHGSCQRAHLLMGQCI